MRRRSSPVRQNKEVIDSTLIAVAAGTTSDINIAVAINDYIGTVGTCPIGSKVKAVYVEQTQVIESASRGRMDTLIGKTPGSIVVGSLPTPGAVGGNINRKFIWFERKGFPPSTNSGDVGSRGFAGWILIPKRFQNMAEGDEIVMRVNASLLYSVCTKFIYKWTA